MAYLHLAGALLAFWVSFWLLRFCVRSLNEMAAMANNPDTRNLVDEEYAHKVFLVLIIAVILTVATGGVLVDQLITISKQFI